MLWSLRVVFLLLCFFLLAFLLDVINLNGIDSSFIPWYGKTIVAIGLVYGILVTVQSLFNRTKLIYIAGEKIYIYEPLKGKKSSYPFAELKSVSEAVFYDYGNFFRGLRFVFKNGDVHQFLFYEYFNYGKLKATVNKIKEVKEFPYHSD